MDEKRFLNPEDACRGTDFWMLNDALDENEMRRQLRSMREAGVASVIARTYIGLRSDYPGPDFMHKMRVAVAEAKSLGMQIVMQAGYMPEAVLGLPPVFSIGDLRIYPAGEGEGEELCTHGDKAYCVVPSLKILDMLDPEACAFYVQQSYEGIWRPFEEEFGKTLVSVWVDEPSFRHTSLPWTKRLPQVYKDLFGEEFPKEKAYLLFEDGDGAELLRLRYWRTVLYLMKHSYFRAVRDWCNQNGLLFSGHLMEEDGLEMQIRATCFTMPMYQFFDIPGIDYLTAEMNWEHGEIKAENPYDDRWRNFAYFNTPLQCSSAAHQHGKRAVLAEMYGVTSENMGFRDQKYMFDRLASLGVNHRSVHGYFYSLRGRGKRAYPAHVHDYQPYFKKYRVMTDTVARESAFLRMGQVVKDILLLHPMETAFSLYHGKQPDESQPNQKLLRLDRAFNETVRNLSALGANFEFGDEDTLSEFAHVAKDGLQVGQMHYKAVILPPMKFLREGTLSLLSELLAAGGQVLILGDGPDTTDAGRDCKAALASIPRAYSTAEVADWLKSAPASYRFQPRSGENHVQILLRREGEESFFFLMNTDCKRKAEGVLRVPGGQKARRCDPQDGKILPYPVTLAGDETLLSVALPAGGSMLLQLCPGKGEAPTLPRPRMQIPLLGDFRVKREDPNVLLLESFRFARGDAPLSEMAFPIVAIQGMLLEEEYRGEITLQTTFRTRVPLLGCHLALERPTEQTLVLDGTPLANTPEGRYLTFGFETVALPEVEAGVHTLTLRRNFSPMRKPTMAVTSLFEDLGGVQLEPMYLIGDFAVNSAVEHSPAGCIRMNDDFSIDKETGLCGEELVSAGYPFYAGVMTLEKEITLPEGENYALSLQGLHAATAEVFCNGASCGMLTWAPYEVPLVGAKSGKNTLTIRLYGTLRNLIGPFHRTVGEIGACWGGYGAPDLPWEGRVAHETKEYCKEWYLDRKPDRMGWTDSYLCLPFGIADATLSWEEKQK